MARCGPRCSPSWAAIERVKLVTRGRADVWLADGHDRPPDGRPLVVQVHEAAWRDPFLRSLLDPGFAAQINSATEASVSVAAHVITPSCASRRQVIDAYGLPAERVHTVHHGVDHELFRPGLEGGRRRVGAPYVLFVGVLHPRKNFAAARRAVCDLASAGLPHLLAIVAGAAPDPRAEEFERQALAELGGHPGRIVAFRGLSGQELARLMAGAEAFCLPSWFEGFGLPALEAMACGAPVVVSDRGALPEIVGDAGLVVAPDPAAVSGAVRRLVAEPELARRLRRAAVSPRRAVQLEADGCRVA